MDDLISEFITETSESLSVLDLELVKLEQNPNDKTILGNIFRLVHTIKGTCGFLGLPRLEAVAHAGEDVLGKIRDDEIQVTPEAISIVLEALDHIKNLIEYLSNHTEEPEGEDAELIARLNRVASGKSNQQENTADVAQEKATLDSAATSDASDNTSDSDPTLDELERLFNETEVTINGGMEDAQTQQADSAASTQEHVPNNQKESAPEPVKSAPMADVILEEDVEAAKAEIDQKAKEVAQRKTVATPAKTSEKETPAASAANNLANQSIRVNLQVLEDLMQMVGELVLTRNQLVQIVRSRNDNELKSPLQHLSQITTELQEGVMKTRMQPIGNAWATFPRLIRDLSIELHKKIELHMEGAETELDRQLLEYIKDPLTHMVRNSCDHGLETPEERELSGKPAVGTVTLSAYHEGGHIIIKISDNGRGIGLERVTKKALENGLTTDAELASMTDQQILQFIFKPGFSTAEKVTSVSGRGVGMDVVRTNIEKIGGNVELTSQPGKGSTFHIKIPLTLAIVSVLIVEANIRRFAIPQINVVELVRSADDSEYQIEDIGEGSVLRLRDKLLPLVSLSRVLNLPEVSKSHSKIQEYEDLEMEDVNEQYIVVCMIGDSEFGLVVDKIYDTEEIVVKPVSDMLSHISVYSGNTILGDGNVIMILDPNGLAREINGGEVAASGLDGAIEDAIDVRSKERHVSFLLFGAGEETPKSVPLELVSRLEEIDVSQIEHSSGKPVIQYRDDLMRLVTLPCHSVPQKGLCDVIVFTYDNKTVGLVVDDIVDIVRAPLSLKLSSKKDEYLGSMIIDDKTTDVVDVGYLLKDLVDDVSSMNIFERGEVPDECRLLFVEDSVFFRKLTIPFLQNAGYEVNGVGHPNEALDLLKRGIHFDAIITDIEMPDMDGFELAELIREKSEYKNIPIIAFTSTINQHFIAKSRHVGMHDIILKTNREALVQSIYTHLDTAPHGEETSYG